MTIDTNTPHVESAWAEAFLLELRLRGVAGSDIGAALAEVEAHCAESGERALDAFGNPTTYAADLALPASALQAGNALPEVGTAAVGLVGMFATVGAVVAWQADRSVGVTVGAAVATLLLGTCLAVLGLRTEPTLRFLIDRPWVAGLGSVALTGAMVASLALLRQTLIALPWQPILVIGILLVAADLVWSWRHRDTVDDPVVGPTADGTGTLATSAWAGAASRLGPWLTPLLTVLLCVFVLTV